jgi:hypothetical protein
MKKLKEQLLPQLLVIYLRYLVGGAFLFASFIKIKGLRFTTNSGALEPIQSNWHFFETLYQSGMYWQFLGWGQLIAGGLLMTQRFAFLGALVFLPILTNVFVITISYNFGNTPIITGLMLLSNLFLLVWDWNKTRVLINLPLQEDKPNRIENNIIWVITGILLFLFTSVYRILVDEYVFIFWLLNYSLIGLGGLIFWRIKMLKK